MIKLLLAGGRSFFFSTKSLYLPITKNILQIFTFAPAIILNNFHLYTLFQVAWAGFIKPKQITYTIAKKATTLFHDLYLTRSDVIFFKKDEYATLKLKQSKTNTNHIKVLIMLIATNNSICSVTVLCSFFTHNFQSLHTLFLPLRMPYSLNNILLISYKQNYCLIEFQLQIF